MAGEAAQLLQGGLKLDMESVKYGLISTFKTGNVVVDTLLCCLVPLAVSIAVSQLSNIKQWWDETGYPLLVRLIFGPQDANVKPEFTRVLTTRKNNGANYYGSQQTDKTKQLMTAISLYIKSLKKTLKSADVSLIDVEETTRNNSYYYYSSSADQNKDPFQNHEVLWEISSQLWLEVAEGVEFMRVDEVSENNNDKNGSESSVKSTLTFSFRSRCEDGDKRIDEFITTAYEHFKADVNKRKDNVRYFFNYCAKDFAESGNQNFNFKRFALSDEKSFESIFLPAKEELMVLLDHFKNKTGRYAIKGSAHKLGLLLHGPPGTGKTSFIKALANHTGRHIVSIPLARIDTNEELIDLMFDLSFRVHGSDYPVKLTHKDILWVMEDVDAASDVVQKRAPTKPAGGKTVTVVKTTEHVVRKAAEGGALAAGAGGGDGEAIDRGFSVRSSDRDGTHALAEGEELVTTVIKEISHEEPSSIKRLRSRSAVEEGEGEDEGLDPFIPEGDESDDSLMDAGEKQPPKKKAGPSKFFERKDKLNLAGLLEVLDGVVDTPNRLVIMTSNHPELLDSALIRPGRIDKKLKLDYLAPREAVQMAEHFLGEFEEEQRQQLGKVLLSQGPRKLITPAVLEQACTENETPDRLIKALEEMVRRGPEGM